MPNFYNKITIAGLTILASISLTGCATDSQDITPSATEQAEQTWDEINTERGEEALAKAMPGVTVEDMQAMSIDEVVKAVETMNEDSYVAKLDTMFYLGKLRTNQDVDYEAYKKEILESYNTQEILINPDKTYLLRQAYIADLVNSNEADGTAWESISFDYYQIAKDLYRPESGETPESDFIQANMQQIADKVEELNGD